MDRFLISTMFSLQEYLLTKERWEGYAGCDECREQYKHERNRTAQLLLEICIKAFREDTCTPEQWRIISEANESIQALVFPADLKPNIEDGRRRLTFGQ
jgi:hypothetical protein